MLVAQLCQSIRVDKVIKAFYLEVSTAPRTKVRSDPMDVLKNMAISISLDLQAMCTIINHYEN